jgi:hypothetical protein
MVAAEVDAEVRLQPSPLKRGVVGDELVAVGDLRPDIVRRPVVGVVDLRARAIRELWTRRSRPLSESSSPPPVSGLAVSISRPYNYSLPSSMYSIVKPSTSNVSGPLK